MCPGLEGARHQAGEGGVWIQCFCKGHHITPKSRVVWGGRIHLEMPGYARMAFILKSIHINYFFVLVFTLSAVRLKGIHWIARGWGRSSHTWNQISSMVIPHSILATFMTWYMLNFFMEHDYRTDPGTMMVASNDLSPFHVHIHNHTYLSHIFLWGMITTKHSDWWRVEF